MSGATEVAPPPSPAGRRPSPSTPSSAAGSRPSSPLPAIIAAGSRRCCSPPRSTPALPARWSISAPGPGSPGSAPPPAASGRRVVLVERDPGSIACAREALARPANAAFADRVRLVTADIAAPQAEREQAGAGRDLADHVLLNPPFYDRAGGTRSPAQGAGLGPCACRGRSRPVAPGRRLGAEIRRRRRR